MTYHNCREWKSGGRVVTPSDGIDCSKDQPKWQRQDRSSQNRIPRPVLSFQLLEQATGNDSAEHTAHSKNHDACRKQRTATSSFESTHQNCEKQQEHCKEQLSTSTDDCTEDIQHRRGTEHISVNHLPASLFFCQFVFINLHVLGEVLLQDAHKNDRQESCQEEDQHEGVDDRQPVNLESCWEER